MWFNALTKRESTPRVSVHQAPQEQATDVDLSIIIVSWNVWDLIRACLQAIEQITVDLGTPSGIRGFGPRINNSPQPTLEVIVVDNASLDATVELLPARFPWVRLIRSATNLGFTGGNNIGYAASRGRAIYFLNPDTELVYNSLHGTLHGALHGNGVGSDSLWTLYSVLMENPDIGVVGPQLRYADNTLQSSRRRFPSPLTGFFESTWLGKLWRGNPWNRHLQMDDWPSNFRQEVDWLVGAAMMARRSALETIRLPDATGPFDEGFFMYSEELDLCRRLKQAKWRIVYVPEAVVIHYEGRSSEQVVAARHIHFNRSKVRYYEKYFGRRWATLLRAFLLLEFRRQWLLEGAKWLLGHKRELRARRMAAYREVLANGLRPTP